LSPRVSFQPKCEKGQLHGGSQAPFPIWKGRKKQLVSFGGGKGGTSRVTQGVQPSQRRKRFSIKPSRGELLRDPKSLGEKTRPKQKKKIKTEKKSILH